ncbi:MAG: sigma 54-interacting transcriptional regulator, partial [Alphaproteobacteria bacterium]
MMDHGNGTLPLVAIYEISKILTSSLKLEAILRDVINVLSSYLEMQRAMVALKEPDGRLTVLAAAGMSPRALSDGDVQPPAEVVRRIFSTSIPVVISSDADDAADLDRAGLTDIPADEVMAVIGVPIKIADRTQGLLVIERILCADSQHRIDSDVRFLTMVGNLIGQMIRLHHTIAFDREHMLKENHRLQKELSRDKGDTLPASLESIVGNSPRMRDVLTQVRQVAPTRSTVLLRGESGTGKELIARALHVLSPRRNQP